MAKHGSAGGSRISVDGGGAETVRRSGELGLKGWGKHGVYGRSLHGGLSLGIAAQVGGEWLLGSHLLLERPCLLRLLRPGICKGAAGLLGGKERLLVLIWYRRLNLLSISRLLNR